MLTTDEIRQIRAIRAKGFAVIIWTPGELQGANPNRVQDRLIELGWDVIDTLKEPIEVILDPID